MNSQRTLIKTQRDMASASLHKFQISVVLLVLVVLIGAVGFYYIESPYFNDWQSDEALSPEENARSPRSLIDAIYWAVETISTTGYGDITPRTAVGRLWVTGFSIIGLITVGCAGAYALAFIMEGHLTLAVRERKMAKVMKTLQKHYIICGLGRVGREIVRQFRANPKEYVVIDHDLQTLEEYLNNDELRIVGDPTHDEVLKEAGIENAHGLITCLPSDADNVFTILTAKGLNPSIFIISRGENEHSRNKLLRAGANRVVMPSHIGGVRMASMAIRPAVVDFLEQTVQFSHEREPLLLEEIPIREGNPFIGKMLRETKIKSETDVLILGIRQKDGFVNFNPSSAYVIQQGDILIGMGQHIHFEQLRRLIQSD
ncbi:MAG: potassium channel protein [Candidatus Omnitrophica bacterium]|nr:potassium channel protein [Candidatus Omnitrophota bacterium]